MHDHVDMESMIKQLTEVLMVCGLAVSWSGCSLYFEQDRPPGAPDAGVKPDAEAIAPDAMPAPDAVPPWEPPDPPVLEGEPCEIVSDVPEVAYDADMANYSVRFKDGQGLEQSPDLRQSGLLEVENADVDKRDAVEKRLGADQLADSRSATPGDVVPDADRRGIWTRGAETVLQTHDSLYSLKQATDGTFQWRRVGTWIQTRLREAYGNVYSQTVVSADSARIGDEATLVGYALDAGGGNSNIRFSVYSPDMTREIDQSVANSGSRPRFSILNSDTAVLTYQAHGGANQLIASTWAVGDDIRTAYLVPFATMPVVNGVWDVHGVLTAQGDEVTAWKAATPTSAEAAIAIRIGSVSGSQTFAAAPSNHVDVAIAVWPRRIGGSVRVASLRSFISAGTWFVNNSWVDFDVVTGAVTASASAATALADPTSAVNSVAVSFVDRENAYVAVEQDPGGGALRKVTYYTLARGAGLVPAGIVHNGTTLVGQGFIAAGIPTDTLVSAGAEPLSPAFREQLVGGGSGLPRSGWVVFAPRTSEVVARSFVGYTGNQTTRSAQPAKGSMVLSGNNVAWAGPVSILAEPGPIQTADLNSIAVCRIDKTQYPSAPAFADQTAVDAHAGYPRAYDGTNIFEHDWHTLPFFAAADVAGGVNATVGSHFVAVTWEWDDAHGTRFRSAPFFQATAVPITAGRRISLTVEPFSHSERIGVKMVVWQTTAGGVQFFRAAEQATTGASVTFTVDVSDTVLATAEQLDQGPTPGGLGVQTSDRGRVTDFVAFAIDRLFSRDPLKESLARFSIPSREATGFSMHWPLAFAVEEPDERKVTGVAEMDGRIIVGSELGLALLQGDGPDATGSGSYGIPLILRAEQGIRDQAVLARTPIGYAFGTRGGEPKLLSPGLTVEDLAKQVERAYKIDGTNIVSIAYDQNREEMVFLANSGKTLRLNTSTGRWASDPNRLGRDLTVTKDGTLYLIRSDGKVLKQREDVWADGGVGYALKVSTPWIRDMAKDGTTHSSFRLGAVYVSGEYLGPHDLFFDIYKDFNDVTPWGTFQVPAARTLENFTANRGWIYGVRLGGRDSFLAARIVVRDGAEPNRTFRLAQMDIDIETNGSSKYAELPATHYAAVV